MFFPRPDHLPILPEHSFTGARRVDQDLIKVFVEIRDQTPWLLTQKEQIPNTEQFQIFQQSSGPGRTQVIGCQESVSHQSGAQFCGFSARGRAQIQNPVTRFHRQPVGRSHGTWLLKIIQSRKVIRMLCRLIFFSIIIKPVPDPWNRLQMPWRNF